MTHAQIILFSLILVLLILLAAFFSLAETSVMAVNRYRLRHKARLKKGYAIRLLQLLKRPDRLLGAILIGSTFANILASSFATMLAYHFFGETGVWLAAILLTFIILIFAEVTPKTIAALSPESVARWVVYPVQYVLKVLSPAVWLANIITRGLLRLLHIRIKSDSLEPLSREELRSIVYDTAGKISRQYQNMLLGILDLNKLLVDDIMVPRHEIIGLDLEESWEKIVERLTQFQEDWIPVYQDNINQLLGVLYTRDILKLLLTQKPTMLNKELLKQHLQQPYFIPTGTSLSIQLNYFQQSHDKIAFVVDEYGEIQGLITLDDILEEIVGDFTLNLANRKLIQLQADGSYLIDGAVSVREFNRMTEWELPLGGPRTINGLIIEHLESLPHVGIAMLIADYPIEVIQVKDNRVKLARIFPRYVRPTD